MSQIILSAQNFDIYEGDGQDPIARTGAVSIDMLMRVGAEGVILGHSEVGDPAEVVRKKLLTILSKRQTDPNVFPYTTLLVGESWGEFEGKDNEQVATVVSDKLLYILKEIPEDYLKYLVVGYEPQWGSRGSGHDDVPPPSPEFISTCIRKIKQELTNMFGVVGKNIPIIYGGRSTPERTEQILSDENIDGLILGSACNTVQKTLDIAKSMKKVMSNRKKFLHANFKAFNLTDSYEMYISALKNLDDSFIVYISPSHTDIRALKELL